MEANQPVAQAIDQPGPWMDATLAETRTSLAIARRAVEARIVRGTVLEASMDIIATHLNGCPLDLDGLAKAEWLDFIHDVAGIERHLDRTTGKLTDCFVPRYAAKADHEKGSAK